MKEGTLRKVPIEYLWENLVLTDNVYSEDGLVLLVPSGEVITAEKLVHLANFGSGSKNIMTYDESYHRIMDGKKVPGKIQQRMLENKSGYTILKNEVDNLLDEARAKEKMSSEEIAKTSQEIYGTFDRLEITTLCQCMDVQRSMDEALQRHSLNVGILNGLMGTWLRFDEHAVTQLITAGLLHDIGKTLISSDILYAPRKLTPEEFAIIRMHPQYSYDMLQGGFDDKVCQAVHQHHEKLDGTGYPLGLKEEHISLFGRITAITDIYEAMIAERDYKEAHMPFDILEQMRTMHFPGLDQNLLSVFLKGMTTSFIDNKVIMSDGTVGAVAYIPPNDYAYPVIKEGSTVRQIDEHWYCVRIEMPLLR